MKKTTNLVVMLFCIVGFSQQKSTGIINLSPNVPEMTANLTLDNSIKKATLEITGPSDVWFALHFGHFGANQGMKKGDDYVYTNLDQSGVIDGNYAGGYFPPNVDAINNWTVLSSSVILGIRHIKIQRDFIGDGINDFDFKYSDTNIDFAWAKGLGVAAGLGPSFQIAYHGDNWGYAFFNYFTANLGVEDITLNASEIYPNPSNDKFTIKTKTPLKKVSIYSQMGVLIKTINVENNNTLELEVKGLPAGVYLIELQNEVDKSWKKVIVI
jgi:hypothetical protein